MKRGTIPLRDLVAAIITIRCDDYTVTDESYSSLPFAAVNSLFSPISMEYPSYAHGHDCREAQATALQLPSLIQTERPHAIFYL